MTKRKSSFKIFSFLFLFSFLYFSCTECKTGGTEIPEKIKKEEKIGKIHFFLDNSASMNGYLQKDANFNEIISGVITDINNNINPVDLYYISDTVLPYTKTIDQFFVDFATNAKKADGKSSELHKIFEKISESTHDNDVSIFASDCILSFTDAEIKKSSNRDINKNNAYILKSRISTTFTNLKNNKHFVVSVYAFNSKFYGMYYDYQNTKTDFSKDGINRPFYIWVIAKKDVMEKFNKKLFDSPAFKPEQSLQFGLNDEPITQYDIFTQLERKGDDWAKIPEGISGIEINKKEPIQFCVGLNLDKLPMYAKNVAYLTDKIKIESNGCVITRKIVDKSSVDKSTIRGEQENTLFLNATHFIVFQLQDMPISNANIHIYLPLEYDMWYNEWTCPEDKKPEQFENKTFALNYLIDGVILAYNTKNKNYIDFNINLKK